MTADLSPVRCAVCSGALSADAARACPDCAGLLHPSCADWIGGCATYGCPRAASADSRLRRYVTARVAELRAERRFEALLFGAGTLLQFLYGSALTGLTFAMFFVGALIDYFHVARLGMLPGSPWRPPPPSWLPGADSSLLLGPSQFNCRHPLLAALLIHCLGAIPYVLHRLVPFVALLPHAFPAPVVAVLLLLWLAQRRYLTIYNLEASPADDLWINWRDDLQPRILPQPTTPLAAPVSSSLPPSTDKDTAVSPPPKGDTSH